MVFARTSKAAARVTAQIHSGEFDKTYFAVLTASPDKDKGELEDYLLKDNSIRIARIAQKGAKGAKSAKLKYEVVAKKDGLCFARIKPITGRYHQIRVQFAHIGCGVYGDMKYGKRDIKDKLALFAGEVCLNHPITGERLCFSLTPKHFPFNLFDENINIGQH